MIAVVEQDLLDRRAHVPLDLGNVAETTDVVGRREAAEATQVAANQGTKLAEMTRRITDVA